MQRPAPRPVLEAFRQRFGRPAAVLGRAPGRVNLIGDHTDYNEGFVLPVALEACTWVAAAGREDSKLRVYSGAIGKEARWHADADAATLPQWMRYVAGVAGLLAPHAVGPAGADLLIESEVPVGVGLASSAALEVALAFALEALWKCRLAREKIADLCRRAEHESAGVPCGIMDQYVSVHARAGHAFLLDCRSRSWEHIPLHLPDHLLLIVDSGVRHELAAGAYARRRAECAAAVACLAEAGCPVRALRDADEGMVRAHGQRLGSTRAARALHVVTENARVVAAAAAFRGADLGTIGRLMYESHASLRDLYQVSCPELDQLVEILGREPGVIGARMTGGGFGGSVVAVVAAASLARVCETVRRAYDGAGHGPARFLTTAPGAGASVAPVEPHGTARA